MKTQLTEETITLLFQHHVQGDKDKCWNWLGDRNIFNGYGRIEYQRNFIKYRFLAHRISYMYHHNIQELEEEIYILHHCDNKLCINPNHLFKGTKGDNNRDRHNKDRNAVGEQNGKSKLTNQQVLDIRKKYFIFKVSQQSLSREYNVYKSCIHSIIVYKTWKHLP